MSEHEVNTDRVMRRNQGMRHFEGGWPENVDATEADQVDRYLKKTNKVGGRRRGICRSHLNALPLPSPRAPPQDHRYKSVVAGLGAQVETAVRQNNSIDIFEEYFEGGGLDLHSGAWGGSAVSPCCRGAPAPCIC